MLQHLVRLLRRPRVDREKARTAVAEKARASFRELVGDYDAVLTERTIPEPSFLLGTAQDSGGQEVPVRIAFDDLAAHMLIQGATGSGKTSFATWILANALEAGVPVGTVDCKAGFFEASLAAAAAHAIGLAPAERDAFLKRLVVINPFDPKRLVPFNVCRVPPGMSPEVHAYEVARVLAELFDRELGFHMLNILHHGLMLAAECGLTLVELPDVLQDDLLRGLLLERCQNQAVREFFGRRYQTVPSASKEALTVRLKSLCLPSTFAAMLGAEECVDFKQVLDRGDPLFIFLGRGGDAPEELTELMANLILQRLLQGAYANGQGRRPYLVLCDEFFHVLSPSLSQRFDRALTSLRSYGVHLGLLMHQFSQVSGPLRDAILNNCDLVALFRSSSRNAQAFGEIMPETDPELVREALRRTGKPPSSFEMRSKLLERLQRLPDRHCYLYDRRRGHRAVLVRVPDVASPHEAAGVSKQALEEFIEEQGLRRGGIAVPKAALEAERALRRERLASLLIPPAEDRPPEPVKPEPPGPGPASGRRPSGRPRLG